MSDGEATAEAAPAPKRPILQRLAALHWEKIGIEMLGIVVAVVLGMQVSNWNDDRREQAEVSRLLDQLKPELAQSLKVLSETNGYYAVTRAYGDTALAGWARKPGVSDVDFVIAAYQSSQIVGDVTNASAWATIFGSDQLRRIDDPVLRQLLVRVLSTSNDQISIAAADSPYRHNVRRYIPIDIQDAIRAKCGDQVGNRDTRITGLPRQCHLDISPERAASAAAILRSHPELADDLRWHFANTATFLQNLNDFGLRNQALLERIEARRK